MLNEPPRPSAELNTAVPLVVLACGAAGMLIGFGLCGAAGVAKGVRGLDYAGIAVFGLSVIALLVGFFWLILVVLVNAFRRRSWL